MNWPEELVKEAEQNMEPYDVEGFVLGAGDDQADIMIVGEAPGENEAVKGRPFIGRAGAELDKHLDYAGFPGKMFILQVSSEAALINGWIRIRRGAEGGGRPIGNRIKKRLTPMPACWTTRSLKWIRPSSSLSEVSLISG